MKMKELDAKIKLDNEKLSHQKDIDNKRLAFDKERT